MTRNAKMKRSQHGWCSRLPEVAAPFGGGLLKLFHASTSVAVSVALAPTVIVLTAFALFLIGFVPSVICYLCSGQARQDAGARLITASANAIVAILTLTPMSAGLGRTLRAEAPELRVLTSGTCEASEQDGL